MRTIRVSDVTYRAIAELAILPFRSTATRQLDGTWLVPIEEDTYARLEAHRLPGESDDDTLQRVIHLYRSRALN